MTEEETTAAKLKTMEETVVKAAVETLLETEV